MVAEKVYRLSGVWDERMAPSEIELRPSGTGEGTVAGVECDRVVWCVCFSVKNVLQIGDVLSVECLFSFKNVGLWMDCSCRACNFGVGQRSE
jgi:hypothetical protein